MTTHEDEVHVDVFGVDVYAYIYKNDKDEEFVVFSSGYEVGMSQERLDELKPEIEERTRQVEKAFGFTATGETRLFKAEDEFRVDVTAPSWTPLAQLFGIPAIAMKVN